MSASDATGTVDLRRRLLSLVLLGAAAEPLVTGAQPASRPWRVGYLGPSADTAPHLLKAFREGLEVAPRAARVGLLTSSPNSTHRDRMRRRNVAQTVDR
jgi:hypothetical protein